MVAERCVLFLALLLYISGLPTRAWVGPWHVFLDCARMYRLEKDKLGCCDGLLVVKLSAGVADTRQGKGN